MNIVLDDTVSNFDHLGPLCELRKVVTAIEIAGQISDLGLIAALTIA